MAVKARITAIKAASATDSIVTRESHSRVHVDIETGTGISIEVIVRADGRSTIEVKHGRTVAQFLTLGPTGQAA